MLSVVKPLVEMLAMVVTMSPKSVAKPLTKMLVKVKSVMLAKVKSMSPSQW